MLVNFDLFSQNARELFFEPLNIIPQLVVAVAIFIIGCIIGWLADKVIRSVFRALPFFDSALKNVGLEEITRRAGLRVDVGKFFGIVFRVFIVVIFLVTSFDVLGLDTVNRFFIDEVLVYIPNVISASVIIVIGLLVANFVGNLVVGATRAAKIEAGFAGKITKWSIFVFSLLIALSELGIATNIIESFILGAIAAVSISLGLAFGLGGQKAASEFIERVRDDIKKG